MNDRTLTTLRYLGNAQVIIGYFVLLYIHEFTGLALCFTANGMLFPWAIKGKFWDVVIILSFCTVLDGGKMLMLLSGAG